MSSPSYTRGKSIDNSQYAHLSMPICEEIASLKEDVFSHDAVSILKRFEENLKSRLLTREEIRILLASEGMFVLEVPPGIVALASRMTDEWFKKEPFAATGRAARILFAAVDEYGLNDMEHGLLPSHHQLYVDMAAHWGITAKDLLDDRNIVPTAREFASTIGNYYRERPIIEALGFHVANEATAPLDFGVFLATFREYREQYGLKAENDPHLNYLLVHEDVEVSHREMGIEAVQLYTNGAPALVAQARRGVKAYMKCYGRFFAELNQAIFGQKTVSVGRARA
jgi:hypothetical protein